jgi:hypothetical protein
MVSRTRPRAIAGLQRETAKLTVVLLNVRPTSRKSASRPRAAALERYGTLMNSTMNEKELGRADEPLARLEEQLSKLARDTARQPSDPPTKSINTFRSADRTSRGGWALRGFAGILLAAGIGAAAIIWLRSSGDVAKTVPPQSAPLAQTAPTAAAAMPPELTSMLQSMARDLISVGKEIEQLKASREQMAHDNANLSEQLKASLEQLTLVVAQLSEQLKASQDQVARDNAYAAEQIRAIQDQLARINSKASEQNTSPLVAVTPPPPALPRPRPTVSAGRKPGPTLLSPQAAAQPKAEKPKLSSASRPSVPAH